MPTNPLLNSTAVSESIDPESGSMVVRKNFSPNSQLPQYWSEGSEIASMDLVKMDFQKVDPWL